MKIITNKLPIYQVQEDGLISIFQFGEGRLIPAVVLNNSNGKELKQFLIDHVSTIEEGDVTTQWATPISQFFKPKVWLLHVKFHKPRIFEFYIELPLEKHPALIDAIFQSRGLHIRHGYKGDKISKGPHENTITMEIPDHNRDEAWNATLREIFRSRLRKQGIPKKDLTQQVEKKIASIRELLHMRPPVK